MVNHLIYLGTARTIFFIEKTSYYYFSKYTKYKFMFRTHQTTIHMKGESITLSTLNNFPTIMPCYFFMVNTTTLSELQ